MAAKDKVNEAIRLLQEALVELENEVPPEPEVDARLFEVTVAKTNAWTVASTNNAGRMVMKIWPESESKVNDRIQFTQGYKIRVAPKVVKADGGDKFWKIVDVVKKGGVVVYDPLYLRDDHGHLV